MIERATGVEAFSVRKPSLIMMRAARKEMGLRTDEVVMVGDTTETDVLGAVQMGYRSVLVLSGGIRPGRILENSHTSRISSSITWE